MYYYDTLFISAIAISTIPLATMYIVYTSPLLFPFMFIPV